MDFVVASMDESRGLLMPTKFNGDGDWEEWVFHFELVAGVNCWEGDRKCYALGACLVGRALTVYREIDVQTRKDFAAVTAYLQSHFRPPEAAQLDKIAFTGRKLAHDEKLADFASDLRVLGARAYPKLTNDAREELILDKFLNELPDGIRVRVRQSTPASLEAALSVALQMQAIQKLEEGIDELAVPPTPPETDMRALLRQNEEILFELRNIGEGLRNLEQAISSRPTGNVQKCWVCNKTGHVRKNCPNRNSEND